MNSLPKFLIALGLIAAVFIAWRSVYYAPNDALTDEVDSGLTTANASGSRTNPAATSSLPSRLIIPRLGIDADVQRLGVTRTGNMAAPDNFTDVSWYKFGTVPGQVGSAVMAGHEDNAISLDGIFKRLGELEVGDEIYVEREDGERLRFRVTDKKILPYNLSGKALEEVFNKKDTARLNLITCAGDWLPEAKTNNQRLVIYTELVD